jgi:hypothetical protein
MSLLLTIVLNQRVVGSNPGEGTAWYPQLRVAIISRIACGTPYPSIKKNKKKITI